MPWQKYLCPGCCLGSQSGNKIMIIIIIFYCHLVLSSVKMMAYRLTINPRIKAGSPIQSQVLNICRGPNVIKLIDVFYRLGLLFIYLYSIASLQWPPVVFFHAQPINTG